MNTRHKPLVVGIASAMAALLSIAAQSASAVQISFSDFSSTADRALFRMNGSAAFSGEALRLTPDSPGLGGSAFLSEPYFIQSTTDFSTAFQFRINSINPTSLRSDGLAFVVQNVGPSFIGSSGENMGYRNSASFTNSLQYAYAVEFDTYQNGGDLSDNEIAVTETLRTASGIETKTLGRVDLNDLGMPLLDNGNLKNVKIEYLFNGQDNLVVFLSEGNDALRAVLTTPFTDHGLFKSGGRSTYLGFTAATGGGYADHDILNWKFEISEPSILSLYGFSIFALWAQGKRRRLAV